MFFLNTKNIKVSRATINDLIAKIDIDKDGYISVYELLSCIKNVIRDIRGKK